jgi:hypothetical protein
MHIINAAFKNLYKEAINEILSQHGLTNSCTLQFNNSAADVCNNCIFDPMSKVSSNRYNGSGPQPFTDYTVCPVCMGAGIKQNNNTVKQVYLAVIFDSKYFINLDRKVVNIPDGTLQTICNKSHTLDIRNCNSMKVDAFPHVSYERVEDVNIAGLGDLEYIITTWRRQ